MFFLYGGVDGNSLTGLQRGGHRHLQHVAAHPSTGLGNQTNTLKGRGGKHQH